MAEVSITLAELSMNLGRTVMTDVSIDRSVNWPIVIWPISLTFVIVHVYMCKGKILHVFKTVWLTRVTSCT